LSTIAHAVKVQRWYNLARLLEFERAESRTVLAAPSPLPQ